MILEMEVERSEQQVMREVCRCGATRASRFI